MTLPDDAARIQQLEKENRVLLKKLHRSETNRSELERTHELKESLLRQVIQDLRDSERTIEEKNHALQHQAQTLETLLFELKQTQSQLIQSEKMSSLGQLVAGVAHEINNPTNFIYGNIAHAWNYAQDLMELLQCYQKHYPKPVEELAEQIENFDLDFIKEDFEKVLGSMQIGAERIQNIVGSLRTFSRLNEAEIKKVDLHEGIESTLLILAYRLRPRLDYPGIEVLKDYRKLPRIECYAGQLNQVFMNLLTNAIDALEEQFAKDSCSDWQPRLTIRTQLKDALIQICIADNGTGIPQEIQNRLFDPFFTTKAIGKGTGLGLAISYQIVTQRHGGNLRCLSKPGVGTEFWIEIPIKN
jgi:signal transduction histidine kinase